MSDPFDSLPDGNTTVNKLNDLIAEHPLLAVAAAAAAGAGVVALIAAAAPRGAQPSRLGVAGEQLADKTAELQTQFQEWLARLNDALPNKDDASTAVRQLGGEAASLFDTVAAGARQSVQGAANVGAQIGHTAAAHPVWTSVLLGALGTAVAAVAASSQQASAPADEGEPLGGMPPDTPTTGYVPTGEATL